MKRRYRVPDVKNALSMISVAKREMDYTLSLKLTEESGRTIVRNIYECFRMLGDTLLLMRGIEAEDHIEAINALLSLQVSAGRPVSILHNLRRLRHSVNYYGYVPTSAEVQEAISIAKNCFVPLVEAVKKEIQKV